MGRVNVAGRRIVLSRGRGFRYSCGMLDLAKVNMVVADAANAAIKDWPDVRHVESKPAADEFGHEILDITILLRRGSFDRIDQDGAVNIIYIVGQALQAESEDRSPVLTFVTEEDLDEQSGDSES